MGTREKTLAPIDGGSARTRTTARVSSDVSSPVSIAFGTSNSSTLQVLIRYGMLEGKNTLYAILKELFDLLEDSPIMKENDLAGEIVDMWFEFKNLDEVPPWLRSAMEYQLPGAHCPENMQEFSA